MHLELGRAALDLRWKLHDLHGRLLREKRDWLECIRQRLQLAAQLLLGLFNKLIRSANLEPTTSPQPVRGRRKKAAPVKPEPIGPATGIVWNMLADRLREGLQAAEATVRQSTEKPEERKVRYVRALWKEIQTVLDLYREFQELIKPADITRRDLSPAAVQIMVLSNANNNTIGDAKLYLERIVSTLAIDASAGEHLRLVFDCVMDSIACLRHYNTPTRSLIDHEDLNLKKLKEALVDPGKNAATNLIAQGVDARGLYARFVGMNFDIQFEDFRFEIEKMQPWGYGRFDSQGRLRADSPEKDEKFLNWSVAIESTRQNVRVAPMVGDEELARRMCQYDLLQAECLLWLARYEEVHRVLDRSTSLLHAEFPQHRFLLAIVHWIRAFNQMHSADEDLQERLIDVAPPGSGDDVLPAPCQEARPRIATAYTKLLNAETSLAEAERMLRNGRRSIGQWRRLYNAKAQVQIEQLLLLLVSPDIKASRLQFVATVHTHLSKGLEAIRGGWDCSLNMGPDDNRDRRDWAVQWLQLMSAGYLTLWLYAELRRSLGGGESAGAPRRRVSDWQQASDAQVRSQTPARVAALFQRLEGERELTQLTAFVDRWRALNLSAGLDRFIDPGPHDVWIEVLQKTARRAKDAKPARPDALTSCGDQDPCWLRQLVLSEAEGWLAEESAPTTAHTTDRTGGHLYEAGSIVKRFLHTVQTPR